MSQLLLLKIRDKGSIFFVNAGGFTRFFVVLLIIPPF